MRARRSAWHAATLPAARPAFVYPRCSSCVRGRMQRVTRGCAVCAVCAAHPAAALLCMASRMACDPGRAKRTSAWRLQHQQWSPAAATATLKDTGSGAAAGRQRGCRSSAPASMRRRARAPALPGTTSNGPIKKRRPHHAATCHARGGAAGSRLGCRSTTHPQLRQCRHALAQLRHARMR